MHESSLRQISKALKRSNAAQLAWEKMIHSSDANEKEDLKKALLEYCRKDTLVMVELVKWLFANRGSDNTKGAE